jgi:hemerythrin-like domain-containing protein
MAMVDEPLADGTDTYSADMYAARAMLALHTMFRREFGVMPDLVRAVTAGDTQRASLVADHIALVSGVLNQHHSGEGRHVWPRLRERCPEQCTPLADVMEDLRHAVQTNLLQVEEAARAWRDSASAQTRGVLADAVERLIQVTIEHLALEEEHVVPIVAKHITEDEYAAKVREHAASIPRDKLPAVFGMVMYDDDPVVIGMFVAEMPVEVQPVVMDLAVKAYAAYAADLYGTATPPSATGLTPAI